YLRVPSVPSSAATRRISGTSACISTRVGALVMPLARLMADLTASAAALLPSMAIRIFMANDSLRDCLRYYAGMLQFPACCKHESLASILSPPQAQQTPRLVPDSNSRNPYVCPNP